jgi:hypothetical protein
VLEDDDDVTAFETIETETVDAESAEPGEVAAEIVEDTAPETGADEPEIPVATSGDAEPSGDDEPGDTEQPEPDGDDDGSPDGEPEPVGGPIPVAEVEDLSTEMTDGQKAFIDARHALMQTKDFKAALNIYNKDEGGIGAATQKAVKAMVIAFRDFHKGDLSDDELEVQIKGFREAQKESGE